METKKAKNAEFHVLLSGVDLPEEVEKRIELRIQEVVTSELAGFRPNPDDPGRPPRKGPIPGGPYIVIPPIKWPGYILRALGKNLAQINGQELRQLEEISQRGML